MQTTAAFCWSNILRLMAEEEADLPFSVKEQQVTCLCSSWAAVQLGTGIGWWSSTPLT